MLIARERSRSVFRKLERDILKLAEGQKPDAVHAFRTGTRRLQTLLTELVPERDRNQKKLLKMLARIRKRAGKVRDLDVQLTTLRTLKMPQEPRRKTQLVNVLIELRAEHEQKLHKALSKETVRELRRRLKKASKGLSLEAGRNPLAVATEMMAGIKHADRPLTEDVLHQYRILSKRARYAAEFSEKSAEADQFLAQLKRVQDALGDWHDWLTLTQTAARRLGDVHESSLVAALHNVTGAKFRHAVAALSALPPAQAPPKIAASQRSSARGVAAKAAAPSARLTFAA